MRVFLIALAVVSIGLPAFGKTHVITVLGTEPLFGACSSRDQFFAFMRRYPQRENVALEALGLDRAEFERGMRSAQNVVTGGPLHLDAMAYYANGVKIVRDVQIPAHTRLWVSHLARKTVYVPQICGNISTVAVAAVGAYRAAFGVSAREEVHPARPAGAIGPNAALATSPVAGVKTSSSTGGPPATTAVGVPAGAPPPAVHHGGFPWFIFLIPVVLIHGSGGGGEHSGAIPPPILIPRSSSSPSPSPSPAPSHSPSPTPSRSPSPSPSHTPCPSPPPKPSPTPCPSSTRR